MKLLRYGPQGREKPGALDADGSIRDLSGIVPDIAGQSLLPETLEKLIGLDPSRLPRVSDHIGSGPASGAWEICLYRPELLRSCYGSRNDDSCGAGRLHESHVVDLRAKRRNCPPSTVEED
jgi:hypothetical protein